MHLFSFNPPSVPLYAPCRCGQKGGFYSRVNVKLTNRKFRQFLNPDVLPLPPQIRDSKLYFRMQICFTWGTLLKVLIFVLHVFNQRHNHSLAILVWIVWFWSKETPHTVHSAPGTVGPRSFLMDTVVARTQNTWNVNTLQDVGSWHCCDCSAECNSKKINSL